jgi:hypothetical protein
MLRTIVVLLLAGLLGCRSNFVAPGVTPQPSSEPVEVVPSEDDKGDLRPSNQPNRVPDNATQGFAVIANHVMHLRYTVNLEREWTYQVFLDVDRSGVTGRQGWDYLARGPRLDPFGQVVRSMVPSSSQRDGLGEITGYFTSQWVGDRHQLRLQIPLTSIPECYASGSVMVEFYRINGQQLETVGEYKMKF